MKSAFCLAWGVAFCAAVLISTTAVLGEEEKQAGELTDPVEILKKMDEAAKKVTTVAYDVEFDATGDMAKFVNAGKGSVILSGWHENGPEKYKVEVEVRKAASEEARRLAAGSDGENYYLIDYAAKTAYEDVDPGVMGSGGQSVFSAMMQEFVHPEPFSDEINGTDHALQGSEKVGDEDCYVVFLKYAKTTRTAKWSVSKKDFLPRRRIDFFENAMMKGEVRKSITRLVIDPKFDDDAFKLKLPEGFTKSDDFAP